MALTYVVTGASRGLGAEFVRQLSSNGHTVIACARNPSGSKELMEFVDNKLVYAVIMDVADVNSIKTAAEKIQQIAPQGIDVLINNAGISGDALSLPAMEFSHLDFTEIFQTNVVGTFVTTQTLLPLLRKKNTRQIINITSGAGSIELTTIPIGTPYRASKAALNMMTKSIASQLGPEGFIVVPLSPGWVLTESGGPNAQITRDVSISGMINVLNHLTSESNGKFINYDGTVFPW
ncbi:4-dihydrotrisporin dehydrogenase [Fennellomyces sp. T-0311]|nr:4-dihydrotrisporin dehydrogenase [Fennellomyces sp. T-0311]